LFDALVQKEFRHPAARNFVANSCSSPRSRWRFRDPSLHRFDEAAECDKQTDGRTDLSTVAEMN